MIPVVMWRIPLSDLNYDEAEERAVMDVLRSKWLTMGPKTEEFESLAASYLGVRHAIAVSNCTCALELAYEYVLESRPFPPGTPPMILAPNITFVATMNAAIKAGARPLPVDIEAFDLPLIRRTAISQQLEQFGTSLAAVAVVHYAGFDANVEEIGGIAGRQGIAVIEDAAHAFGGLTADGKPLGTIGDIGCFSFFSNKNLATGEGGLLVTNNDEIATALRNGRSHGMTSLTSQRHRSQGHGYDVVSIGHNYRCTEITAALAIEQLKKLDAGNRRRRAIYTAYAGAFRDNAALRVPFGESPDAIERSACHIFPLLCKSSTLRNRMRDALTEAGIQTSHHYPPVHTLSAYRNFLSRGGTGMPIPNMDMLGDDFPASKKDMFPLAASVHFGAREITLPLYPGLSDAEIEEICDAVNRASRPAAAA